MSSDRLTLVVFKDHLSSRTLTVRLAWLRAFGLALLSVIALAVIAGSLFFNAYRKTITSGALGESRKAEELEKELGEVKASYESLKEQALNRATGAGTGLGGSAYSFSALPPDSILESLPAKDTLPFRLENMKATWKGGTLHIRSAIEYSREDGGNQQGHFVLLVRGQQSLHVYPEGVFAGGGNPSLIKPDAGEFFSVSRYREVNADFGPYAKRSDAQNIEIYVFDTKNRLIYFDRVGLETTTEAKAPPAPSAPIQATEDEAEKPAPAHKAVVKPKPTAAAAPATTPKEPAAAATAAPESAPTGEPTNEAQ